MDVMAQGGAAVRNVTVAGHLHHGKTSLMDIMVQLTHLRNP